MNFSPLFKKFFPYLAIIACGFLLYYQTLSFSYSYFDDNILIMGNQITLSGSDFSKIFTSDVFNGEGAYYRPLLIVSLLPDYFLGNTDLTFFHFTNIILHILTVCLIYYLFKEYFFSKKTSFFLALLFLTHPILTQAVAWIPGRNDSLLAIFVIPAFIYFLKFLKTEKIIYLLPHTIFFALALFTKETAICLIPICLAYYFIEDHKIKNKNTYKIFLVTLVAWTSCLLFWSFWRVTAINLLPNVNFDPFFIVKNIISFSIVYLGKFLFPINLSVLATITTLNFKIGLIGLMILCLLFLRTPQKNWRRIIFGLVWFLLFLIPSFIGIDVEQAFLLEHRLYVPMVGLLIVIAELVPLKNINWKNKIVIAVAFLIISIFSVLTIKHSRVFSNSLTFWNNAVSGYPQSSLANFGLGLVYKTNDDFQAAKKYYLKALDLNYNQKALHAHLGDLAKDLNQLDVAEKEYQKELIANPNYYKAWNSLGALYLQEKRFTEAKSAFLKTLEIKPNDTEAYNNLLILSSKVE